VTRGGFERAGKAEFELLTGRYEVNRDTFTQSGEKDKEGAMKQRVHALINLDLDRPPSSFGSSVRR
jgi:hypothetical protein